MIKTGVELITEERQRQLQDEGWTIKRDTIEHPDGELALAAVSYLLYDVATDTDVPDDYWPWDWMWWKPTDLSLIHI